MAERREKSSDEEIIQGIREHDRKILTEVYRQLFPMVESMVKIDGGSKADAWDVFQEAVGAIYNRLVTNAEQFSLESSFATFFYAVSKRIWQKHVRWRKAQSLFIRVERSRPIQYDEQKMDEQIRDSMMFNLFLRNIAKLKPVCRNLIEATIKGLKTEEMIALADLGSAQAVYNKRRSCIEKLFKLIKTDPDYFIFKDYEKP